MEAVPPEVDDHIAGPVLGGQVTRLQHHAVVDHVEPDRQELVGLGVTVCKR